MSFDRIPRADLSGWAEEQDAMGWKKVVGIVAARAQGEAPRASIISSAFPRASSRDPWPASDLPIHSVG